MTTLNIYGNGGHSRVVQQLARHKYNKINIFDENNQSEEVVGNFEEMINYNNFNNCDNFIALGDNEIREQKLKTLIDKNIKVTSLIDNGALLANNIEIGKGSIVMPGCIINSNTKIGVGCIINTGSLIDHDCKLNDYVHISPGCKLGGTIVIGRLSWIGIGTTIINNISIGDNVKIAAGSTIYKDIRDRIKIIQKVEQQEHSI